MSGGGLLRGEGTPQKLHMADPQLIDFEAAAQQSQTAPNQPDLVDLQPWPVAIGEHDVADRRVGGQHAVDRADGDACRLRGQRPRDEVGEDALVRVGGARRRASDDQRDDRAANVADRMRRRNGAIRKPARC